MVNVLKIRRRTLSKPLTKKGHSEQEFKKRVSSLQEEAIDNDQRIIIVEKGYSRPKDKNSSLGKPHKGHKQKRLRNEGVFYQESKKRVSYTLTPTARDKIQQLSRHLNISESETIERFGRSWIPQAIVNDDLSFEKSDRFD